MDDTRTLEEQLAHCDGRDCECLARSSGECGCDADWTPAEVYRLRAAGEEIERLRAERDALRESNKALHRRCQQAESAVPEYRKILALPPNGDGVRFVNGSLGRIFANAACEKLSAENDALRARIEGAAVGFWCEAMPAYICLPKNWLEVVKPWTDGKRVALVVVDD